MGKLDGKVALVTGAARGQGRSHAVRLASEGADIIALDICSQIATVGYGLATPDDLAETCRQIEALDRRVVAAQVDTRDFGALLRAVDDGAATLGPIDIVVANAGIAAFGVPDPDEEQTFLDIVAVNLTGTWNTVRATAPRMIDRGEGGSLVLISSTQGLSGRGGDGSAAATAYAAAKHGVVGLMRSCANWLSPHMIRVNTIHPTGVNTPMLDNDVIATWFADNPQAGDTAANLMPVPMIEAGNVSDAVVWLASDEAKFVTGAALPVDAGFLVK
jgi:SDR family mycofactocin-dependent oxidoreductase